MGRLCRVISKKESFFPLFSPSIITYGVANRFSALFSRIIKKFMCMTKIRLFWVTIIDIFSVHVFYHMLNCKQLPRIRLAISKTRNSLQLKPKYLNFCKKKEEEREEEEEK